MTEQDVKFQYERVAKYNALIERRTAIRNVQLQMAEKTYGGDGTPSIANPFSGNWRECRNVNWIRIGFTPTRGGESGVSVCLNDLRISAFSLGSFIRAHLDDELRNINIEIEKL